jgi:hypothetical protein
MSFKKFRRAVVAICLLLKPTTDHSAKKSETSTDYTDFTNSNPWNLNNLWMTFPAGSDL